MLRKSERLLYVSDGRLYRDLPVLLHDLDDRCKPQLRTRSDSDLTQVLHSSDVFLCVHVRDVL